MPPKKTPSASANRPKHRWRECPLGMHWRSASEVDAHLRKGNPVTPHHRSGSCVRNPSGKDQIYEEELHRIAERYFGRLRGAPKDDDFKNPKGNSYDSLIRGWTRYWNEVLKPTPPLDPNLVKALIKTESSFKTGAKARAGRKAGWARGLMQVTDETLKFLAGEGRELRDHFVHVDQENISDPNLNIAAGIRWLFRKKEIADAVLKQRSSWMETIRLYKGYPSMNDRGMRYFIQAYERLQQK